MRIHICTGLYLIYCFSDGVFNKVGISASIYHPVGESIDRDRIALVPENLISFIKELSQKGVRLNKGCIA